MKPLALTAGLAAVARRCIWFKKPADAIANPVQFAAYVLTYGTHEDVEELRKQLSDDDLQEVIENAPPGIFDARSWAYWNLMLGRYDAPPLPTRRFDST